MRKFVICILSTPKSASNPKSPENLQKINSTPTTPHLQPHPLLPKPQPTPNLSSQTTRQRQKKKTPRESQVPARLESIRRPVKSHIAALRLHRSSLQPRSGKQPRRASHLARRLAARRRRGRQAIIAAGFPAARIKRSWPLFSAFSLFRR